MDTEQLVNVGEWLVEGVDEGYVLIHWNFNFSQLSKYKDHKKKAGGWGGALRKGRWPGRQAREWGKREGADPTENASGGMSRKGVLHLKMESMVALAGPLLAVPKEWASESRLGFQKPGVSEVCVCVCVCYVRMCVNVCFMCMCLCACV